MSAVYALQVGARGPIIALHVTGFVIAVIAASGVVLAAVLPAARNAPGYGST